MVLLIALTEVAQPNPARWRREDPAGCDLGGRGIEQNVRRLHRGVDSVALAVQVVKGHRRQPATARGDRVDHVC